MCPCIKDRVVFGLWILGLTKARAFEYSTSGLRFPKVNITKNHDCRVSRFVELDRKLGTWSARACESSSSSVWANAVIKIVGATGAWLEKEPSFRIIKFSQ